MKILHVGSGYRPLRWGGLIAYAEDLMAEQVRRGDEVAYFFAGRYFRWPRRPRLRPWWRKGVEMLEVLNSPLYDHGRQPELELSERQVEALFNSELEARRPDVVHVQELAGLPSSLLDLAKDRDIPVVMTLQDYFPLCSTFKLLDADDNVCLRREIGADCVATVRADSRPSHLLFEGTMRHALMRRSFLKPLGPDRREALVRRIAGSWLARPSGDAAHTSPEAFQRRREVNLTRLNRCDRLLAMSHRVAEIYSHLGADSERLEVMHLTLSHIERLTPREARGLHPVTFATLGGGEGVAKGSRLLAQALTQLSPELDSGRMRMLIFGQCEPELARVAAQHDGIELRGTYGPSRLDALLDEVDVGIMSSIWEEAYGYAGLEFVAKGIPVVANRIGGIVDYVREGETGWLNRTNSGAGLAEIMASLSRDPGQVAEMARTTRAARPDLVTPMSEHVENVASLYQRLGEVSSETASPG